jgi:ribosomal protein S18 acetylase RimI-like enzyme
MSEIRIIKCNFDDPAHTEALVNLMNHYINDKMGGGESIRGIQKDKLIEGLRNLPTSLVLLAEENGQIVGLCNSFINFATFTVKKFINIHDIVVLNDQRGKGIGKRLMEAVIHFAKEIDCSKVTLEVREDNRIAQELYKSLGFKDCSPRMYFWTKMLTQ